MNKFRTYFLILISVSLIIGSCAKKQDLIQKAFEDKNFDQKLEEKDQDVAIPTDSASEKDEETKVDVLIDNIEEPRADSIFIETGDATRPRDSIFANDPEAPAVKFDEIQLYDVVRVLLDQLGVNYIIDPSLKDQAVTLDIKQGGPKFKVSDLLDLLLKLHDLTMVVHENYVHIVPLDNPAVNPGLKLLHGSRANQNLRKEELVIQLIPLKYVTPADVTGIVKEFLSPSARVYEEPIRNVLIIIDKYQYTAKAMELIPIFDVDVLANKKMVFYQLAHVDAVEVGNNIQDILSVYGYDSDGERLSIVPIESLNGILVVSSSTSIFKELDFWIHKFDKEAQFEEEQVFVYEIQNTTADSIAQTLSQLMDLQYQGGFGGNINQGASQRRNSQLGGNSGQNSFRNNNLQNNRTNQNDRNQNPQQQPPAAPTARQRNQRASTSGDDQGPTMVVDLDNNALIFMTTPREYSRILKTLRKLDILPRQVFLEVTVLSVELTDSFSFGIDWTGNQGAITAPGDTDPPATVREGLNNFAANSGNLSSTYTYIGATLNIQATLNALRTKGYTNILQQPHIMAIDNKTASISVGQDIPISTTTTNLGSIVDGGANNPASSSTIQYRSTGVTLGFTPHINANGVIRLEISLDISSPGATQEGAEAVPINQNTLETEMIVRDNQTVVMGGLISDNEIWSKGAIPLLGRIPLLKHFFSNRRNDSAKKELIIMITPRLVDSEEKSIEISKEFKEKILKEFETFKQGKD